MNPVKIPSADIYGRQPSRRPRRVADAIQRQLSVLFLAEIKDPRLLHLTVTGVEVSRDLRQARIFFSCEAEREEGISRALAKAAGFIRSQLARELGLRYVPELRFLRDVSLEQGAAIEKLLRGE